MLALGDAAGIGAIGFTPWVMLTAGELGIGGGILAAGVATGLYSIVAAIDTGPAGPLAIVVRAAAFLVVGAGAGYVGNRLRDRERVLDEIVSRQTALLDAALDGICLTDVEGNPLLSNAPLRRISVQIGLPPFGTVPERLLAVADETTEPARSRERMLRLAATPDETSDDKFELTETGHVFRGYTAPIRGAGGRFAGRIWTLRDVTSDRDLERLRDAFIAAVSHELRTPLTSISGFLELLGDEEHELGETGRGYLTVIRRSTERLQRIVEDLLLVAQIEASRLELSLETVDLADVAATATEAARPAADDKGVTILLSGTDGRPRRGRPAAARPGAGQPRLERGRDHAPRRNGRRRRRARRRPGPARRHRHGRRHPRQRAGAALLPLLPRLDRDTPGDPRHRPRPLDRARDRRAARRHDLAREPGRRGDARHRLAARSRASAAARSGSRTRASSRSARSRRPRRRACGGGTDVQLHLLRRDADGRAQAWSRICSMLGAWPAWRASAASTRNSSGVSRTGRPR